MQTNPNLVEVTRGPLVESVHCGAIAIADGSGQVIKSLGDVEKPIFPRSAIKPLQALYLVESGAVENNHLESQAIALACASHNGEENHVTGVRTMLANSGLTETCLECGAQWPTSKASSNALVENGEKPGALHNNCSGKHAGFLCAAHHLGESLPGYIKPNHPAQREVRGIVENMIDHSLQNDHMATDGCSIPTFAMPLRSVAKAAAKMATTNTMSPTRDRALANTYDACVTHPDLVAGTGRFDTKLMKAMGRDVLVKTGAEGYYMGVVPSLGLGIAIKCDDGGTRASEIMMAGVLFALLKERRDTLVPFINVPITNRNKWHVGNIRLAEGFVEALG